MSLRYSLILSVGPMRIRPSSSTMRKSLKRAALHTLRKLGGSSVLAGSRWRSERLAILCYHGISLDDEHEWDPNFFMDPKRFEGRLQLLRDGGYNVLPLAEALHRLYARTLPPKSVAITIDDGGYDFYRQAFPLLREYGMPATVYLTTFYCFCSRPIFPIFLHYLLWKARNTFQGSNLLGLNCPVDLHRKAGRQKIIDAIVADASERKMLLAARHDLGGKLAAELGLDFQQILSSRILQLMKPDEVSDLSKQGLDIQLHTHRHRTPRDRDLFVREIADNRKIIWEITGVDPVHFCYPSGVYDQIFLPWLAQERVVSATTCESDLAAPSSHSLLLPRIVDTCNLSEMEFQGAIDGVTAAVRSGILRRS